MVVDEGEARNLSKYAAVWRTSSKIDHYLVRVKNFDLFNEIMYDVG